MSLNDKMTGLMDSARALGNGSDDAKLSIDDATSVLRAFKMLTGDPFTISLNKKQIIDADDVKESGIFFISTNGHGEDIGSVITSKKYHYPENGYWWWLINLSVNTYSKRSLQILVPDQGAKLYMRAIHDGIKDPWIKLGGVNNPVLSAFLAPRLEVAA